MLVKAYAKVNLALKVIDKRDDGYHNIESILLPIEMHDAIEIKVDRNASDDFVVCDDFALKHSRYNLCHKAIDVCRERWGFNYRLNVSIHKNIFLQAGLGGGSADAAATINAIVKLFKIKTNVEELKELAIKVGSDVPWSIVSSPAIIKEKGNIVEEINLNRQFYCVIVKPKTGLLTAEVFNKYDVMEKNYGDRIPIKDIANKLVKGETLKTLDNFVYNDLEAPAIELLPEIQNIKQALRDQHFHLVLMSGAGSSVFALTTVYDKAKRAEEYFADRDYQVEFTKTRHKNKI